MRNGIDTIDKPEAPLEQLRQIAPKTAEYCDLFLSMFDDYSVEKYSNPEEALLQFPGLDHDITAIIDQAQQEFAHVDSLGQRQFKAALLDLFNFFNDHRPVSGYLLREFFAAFDIRTIAADTENRVSRLRYKVDNFIIKPRDIGRFFRALGLQDEKIEGSHQKWFDPGGEMRQTTVLSLHAKNIWFPNVLKELIQHGLSLKRIEDACRKLDLQFHYITS